MRVRGHRLSVNPYIGSELGESQICDYAHGSCRCRRLHAGSHDESEPRPHHGDRLEDTSAEVWPKPQDDVFKRRDPLVLVVDHLSSLGEVSNHAHHARPLQAMAALEGHATGCSMAMAPTPDRPAAGQRDLAETLPLDASTSPPFSGQHTRRAILSACSLTSASSSSSNAEEGIQDVLGFYRCAEVRH